MDELLQSLRPARITDEFVSQQLLRARTTIGILRQALGDEIFERVAVLVAFESRRRLLRDQEEHLHRVGTGMGRLAVDHFNGSNAQRPNVGLIIVPGLLDDLRGHPERRADESVALGFDVGQLGRNPKIRQLDLPRMRQEYVGGFDVAVDFPFAVQVI